MSHHQQPPLLERRFPADPKEVAQARHHAMQVCTEAGLTEDDCFALDLALGEALANAVMHGTSAGCARPEVSLSLWNFQKRLIIQIQDHGTGFHPPAPPYLMPEAALGETHGRGLPLMEQLTDAMAICRGCIHDGGSSVFLIKRMPQ